MRSWPSGLCDCLTDLKPITAGLASETRKTLDLDSTCPAYKEIKGWVGCTEETVCLLEMLEGFQLDGGSRVAVAVPIEGISFQQVFPGPSTLTSAPLDTSPATFLSCIPVASDSEHSS